MNKKIIVTLVSVIIFVSLQIVSAQSTEVVAVNMFNAFPLAPSNSCMAGASFPCIDTDSGYHPETSSSLAGLVAPMSLSINATWQPTAGYQCVYTFEYCDTSGFLNEVICGHDVGLPSQSAWNSAYPNQPWGVAGEPVALLTVNCATYATNNPSLGLQGVCQSTGSVGVCI